MKSVSYLLSVKFLAFASKLQLGNSGVVQKWKNNFLRGVSAIRWETNKWKLVIFMWILVPKVNGGGSVFFPWKIGIQSFSVIQFQLWLGCIYSLLYILRKTYISKLCLPTTEGQAVETGWDRWCCLLGRQGQKRSYWCLRCAVVTLGVGKAKPGNAICVICSTRYFLDHRGDLAEFLWRELQFLSPSITDTHVLKISLLLFQGQLQ